MYVTCPNLQNNFNVIEEHYVIFYGKFEINDQVGSRIINVFQNILFINKYMMRQQLREAIKIVLTGHFVEETRWILY